VTLGTRFAQGNASIRPRSERKMKSRPTWIWSATAATMASPVTASPEAEISIKMRNSNGTHRGMASNDSYRCELIPVLKDLPASYSLQIEYPTGSPQSAVIWQRTSGSSSTSWKRRLTFSSEASSAFERISRWILPRQRWRESELVNKTEAHIPNSVNVSKHATKRNKFGGSFESRVIWIIAIAARVYYSYVYRCSRFAVSRHYGTTITTYPRPTHYQSFPFALAWINNGRYSDRVPHLKLGFLIAAIRCKLRKLQ